MFGLPIAAAVEIYPGAYLSRILITDEGSAPGSKSHRNSIKGHSFYQIKCADGRPDSNGESLHSDYIAYIISIGILTK